MSFAERTIIMNKNISLQYRGEVHMTMTLEIICLSSLEKMSELIQRSWPQRRSKRPGGITWIKLEENMKTYAQIYTRYMLVIKCSLVSLQISLEEGTTFLAHIDDMEKTFRNIVATWLHMKRHQRRLPRKLSSDITSD